MSRQRPGTCLTTLARHAGEDGRALRRENEAKLPLRALRAARPTAPSPDVRKVHWIALEGRERTLGQRSSSRMRYTQGTVQHATNKCTPVCVWGSRASRGTGARLLRCKSPHSMKGHRLPAGRACVAAFEAADSPFAEECRPMTWHEPTVAEGRGRHKSGNQPGGIGGGTLSGGASALESTSTPPAARLPHGSATRNLQQTVQEAPSSAGDPLPPVVPALFLSCPGQSGVHAAPKLRPATLFYESQNMSKFRRAAG